MRSPLDATRREFLGAAAAGAAVALSTTTLSRAQPEPEHPLVMGAGHYRYAVDHDWLRLPDRYSWQTTHNVAVDKSNRVYVIHEGRHDLKEHPSIFVFDSDGRFIRAFGSQFQGGGHGLEVREESGEEFLYVTGYKQIKAFSKLTLDGDIVWHKRAPVVSDRYAPGEHLSNANEWGRDRFNPTNFAFPPDGGFLLADGYGAYTIHRYNDQGEWLSCFGSPGDADGQFDTPHGVWIDDRPGREPSIVVADRANGRLQWFTLDGVHQSTLGGFVLPANIDTFGELMLVPDLQSRVTLLDGENNVVAQLGDDPAWAAEAAKRQVRADESRWRPGRFVHPHDACFDAEGNILVAEWVATGRVSKLTRIGGA